MADSLCGPSNALQNFQKHSTVDRTLQQDRLVSRQSPSQGFRSSPGPNGAHLEPEFQAFQRGHLPLETQQGFQPSFSHAPQTFQQPGPAAWASDFQRMQISSPLPQEQIRNQMNAGPSQRQDTGGWHQDFARQFGAEQRVMAQTSQMGGSSYGYSPVNGSMGMGMGMGMQSQYAGNMMGQAEQSNMQQAQQPAEAFDEEAFARAFEEASKSEMDTREDFQERSSTGIELGQDVMLEESAERFMSSTTDQSQIPNQARLGADLIHDPLSSTQERPQQEDPDALARTAGQLLDSVRSNQSAKFQNSEFLELMRQLRDREVMVKGDDIVGMNEEGPREELKNELIELFDMLQRMVGITDRTLDRNASEQVRKILIVLLLLNRSAAMNGLGALSYDSVQRTMQAAISSSYVALLPALRGLANITFHAFETVEKQKSNTPPTPLSSSLESIRLANSEINDILPPTETAVDTLIYNYISSSLQPPPVPQNPDPLHRLLGYTFSDQYGNDPQPSGAWNTHIQRAREIMGPAVAETVDVCAGFWCPLLSAENFFALVAAHQLYGGVRTEGFTKVLKEVEGEIEEGLTEGLKRVNLGYPYRFGVSAMGLKRKGALSYDEQLEALEAQSRLSHLQAHREQRGQAAVSRMKPHRGRREMRLSRPANGSQ